MLGVPLHALHDRHRHQSLLPGQEQFEARTQIRPPFFGQREMATQIKQGELSHLAANTATFHQAVGYAGFAGRAIAGGGGVDDYAHKRTEDSRRKTI
jgi:hypothetical protein